MRIAIVLVTLVACAAAAADGGWSWGEEHKGGQAPEGAAVHSAPVEQARALPFTQDSTPVQEVAAADFVAPLPLEPHSPLESKSAVEHHSSLESQLSLEAIASLPIDQQQQLLSEGVLLDGSGREARFLGLSDTLCNLGLDSQCDKKIKKKGHGYPPSINSQYGVPPAQYNSFATNSYASDFNSYQNKPKGHKPSKKGSGGGVTDLISGFFNSYTKPKPGKGHSGSKVPSYTPPITLEPTYGVPIYIEDPSFSLPPASNYGPPQYTNQKIDYTIPQTPVYIPPAPVFPQHAPSYVEHKPHRPSPQPSFVESSYSAPVVTHHKNKFVPPPPKVATVYTHTVAPAIDATKVQHLHSHTHVYHGAQVVKPGGGNDYVDTHYDPTNIYTEFKKKSDDRAGSGTSFVSGSSGSFSTASNLADPVEASSTAFNSHNENPFESHVASSAGSGFSSHTKFISANQNDRPVRNNIHSQNSFNNQNGLTNQNGISNQNGFTNQNGLSNQNGFTNQNGFNNQNGVKNQNGFSSQSSSFSNNFQSQTNAFGVNGFQAPNTEFGFKPSVTIEDMINQNRISQFARTIYASDCHCIQEQYCAAENVVRASRDISNLLDARHRRIPVYSNATSEEDVPEEVDTNRLARSFNFSAALDTEAANITTESPTVDYDYYYDTELPSAENSTELPVSSVAAEVISEARTKREANETLENFSDVQGRQLTGYTPGPQGCPAGTVCCRRPVYNPARALPVCGRSNTENIHGRIKTLHHEAGRAGFGEYPWQAAILRRSEGEMVYVCGATLIGDQFLVTAAHCVKDLEANSLKVRLGEWDVRDRTEFYPHEEYGVAGVYTHPEFYEGNLENDIAIMKIDRRIDYGSHPHISPVCLPPAHADYTDQVCVITGWGKDDWGNQGEFQSILKETQVPVMRSDVCQNVLRSTRLGQRYTLHKGMLCAGGEENRDACKGDGGGPLVCRGSAGDYQLAGIVSWGIGCGEPGIPGVYVNVPQYIDWITSIVR